MSIFHKNPKQYGKKWFKSLSDDQLNAEREKVRSEYAQAGKKGYDISTSTLLQSLLWQFDKELSARYDERRKNEPPKPHVHWTDENRWDKD